MGIVFLFGFGSVFWALWRASLFAGTHSPLSDVKVDPMEISGLPSVVVVSVIPDCEYNVWLFA